MSGYMLPGSFPGDSVVKNLPANPGDSGSIPGLGRSPGEGNSSPLQYSFLENPTDRGTWQATVHGVTKESDMTEHTHTHTHTHTHGHREQSSCQRGGKMGESGLRRSKLCWMNNKVLLFSTGNYIQYSEINHNGK